MLLGLGEDLGVTAFWTTMLTLVAAGAFALYVWQVRTIALTVIVGLLLLMPTGIVSFRAAAALLREGGSGGGGPIWLVFAVLAANYMTVVVGIVVDSLVRPRAGDRAADAAS
jgi:hypothetical protein